MLPHKRILLVKKQELQRRTCIFQISLRMSLASLDAVVQEVMTLAEVWQVEIVFK